MKYFKIVSIIFLIAFFLIIVPGYLIKTRIKTQVREVFKMNEVLKDEGYYLSEFEFKLLGLAYYLDHGQFIKGLSCLNKIHKQLKNKENLIKIPEFSGNREKLAFYRNLQNPATGAFLDGSYPIFTYFGVTSNMIHYIEDLSKTAEEPFRLKYSLKFLDDINTPEKLINVLNDLSRVGWIGSKFKTPFVSIGELWSLSEDTERLGLYHFSPQWKRAYLQWCYDNQDEETGLWASRLKRTNKLLNGGNLTDSEKMISKFVDSNGNEIYKDFPVKYRDQMFSTALNKLSKPIPEERDKLHEWILDMDRGIRFLTRYLWKQASVKDKEASKKLIEEFMKIRFVNYYIENEGAFSLYPHSEHADLDGTGEAIGMYKYLGALSFEKQKILWGDPRANITELGSYKVSELKETDFALIAYDSIINSIRLYKVETANDYIENTEVVYYPRTTSVPDIADLLPKMEKWVKATSQNMGNWVTKESLLNNLAKIKIKSVPVMKDIPLKYANEILFNSSKLVMIGFDMLQVPRYKIVFQLNDTATSIIH
jgi:hypothetical protein